MPNYGTATNEARCYYEGESQPKQSQYRGTGRRRHHGVSHSLCSDAAVHGFKTGLEKSMYKLADAIIAIPRLGEIVGFEHWGFHLKLFLNESEQKSVRTIKIQLTIRDWSTLGDFGQQHALVMSVSATTWPTGPLNSNHSNGVHLFEDPWRWILKAKNHRIHRMLLKTFYSLE
ncbi:hypothetical protein CPB85DRAFT_1256771 [Mucidula mucida]|nr:hypothetical protein CPB85DRAFT_1256771 [Mucidula mucida]